jgi:rSAM/selenodomain-associated transferase 2/rSAM/selenodomain-associated transferase 1
MNAGAAAATGEWVMFLHADCRLPAGWADGIAAADRDPRCVAGAFRFALDSPDWRARVVEWGVRARVRLFDLPYGDQALFVRRAAFDALDGYALLPLMEDVELVRRLRRHGRLCHSPRAIRTSARRWEQDGWIRRTVTNWIALTAYLVGVPPARLVRWYEGRRAQCVAVLTRDPDAVGKTRLWQALQRPPDPALPRALLADTLAAVEGASGFDRVLVHTGSAAAFGDAARRWTTLPQRGSDLGERMARAFADLFARGHARVVLVGADLPTLPSGAIRRAHALLRRGADLVLGPSEDGGYYLIGLQAPHPALFDGVEWGTPRVFEQTLARARALRLDVSLLSRWYDVDDPDSLRRAAADRRAVHTAAWCRAQSLIP